MSRDENDPAASLERLRRKICNEGAEAAFDALLAVCRDPKAPAPAKATAGTAIMRAAGLFNKSEGVGSKNPAEMTAAELNSEIQRLHGLARGGKNAKQAGRFFD